jgi:hypothetical protein
MKVIDNCVDQYLADELEKIFLDQYTNWLYDSSTAGSTSLDTISPNTYETFQFIHPIMDNGRHDSPYTSLVLRVGSIIFSNLGIEVFNYRRIKVNQLLKISQHNGKHHPLHIDDAAENIVSLLYYINDSDGPTYFFNNSGECVDKVYPKKNRCVVFSSNLLHASSSPELVNRRLVINFVAATNSKVII